MYAILAEDDSDADVLRHLVRRRLNNDRLKIKSKGYDGCGALCRKGARDIKAFVSGGATHVIVCHDADRNPPLQIRDKVIKDIIEASGFNGPNCAAIPVEEIEAWLIADEDAINMVIPSFRFRGHNHPETIVDPKEWLRHQSRANNGKPLYAPKLFNPAVAERLRFDVVVRKCPSFRSFVDWLDRQSINDV